MTSYLDFEKPIADLEARIADLKNLPGTGEAGAVNVKDEIVKLESKSAAQLNELYKKLSPWQKTQVARHPDRPHFIDYVNDLIEEFTPLAGDRSFGDDHAIVAGLGRFKGESVMVMGHEKGNDTESRLKHNFGMARPEGYRKAVRMMDLADRFGIPVITLVDTAGAYPGLGAEERGQAEAIARSTEKCLNVSVPLVSVIIGEGGSGGAISIASGNAIGMLEHSTYSVISPEGCASILWRDSARAADAAAAMKVTAQDLKSLNIIDEIIAEPIGGAHRDPMRMIADTGKFIERSLAAQHNKTPQELKAERRQKFLAMGRNLQIA